MICDDPRLNAGIRNLLEEYARSVLIHTDWQGYDEMACYVAVEDEFIEFRSAVIRDVVTGPHSKEREALQLAVVALKAHLYFSAHVGHIQKGA